MDEQTRKRPKRDSGDGSLRYDAARDRWVGRLPMSVDPKRKAVYGKTKPEAKQRLQRAIRDAGRGLVVLNEDSKLGVYLDPVWLDVVRSRVSAGKLAPSTAVGYERAVRRHLIPKLGRIPLRKLTATQVEGMFGELQAEGLAPATVRRVRAALSRALRDAERDDLIARNVARLTDPPPLARHDPSAFSVDEFRRIVATCGSERLGACFLFSAYAGLRRSEALGLRWRDVDLDAGTFQIREGVHQISKIAERVTGESGLVMSRPKTEASGNALPLSDQAVALLVEHKLRQKKERLRCPLPWPDDVDETHIFASVVGTTLHPSNVSRAWRLILERAEVAHLTSDGRARGTHELRRTFATRLRDRGVPLEDVQRLGRWASSKMLLDVYAASSDDRLRHAANAAGEAMNE